MICMTFLLGYLVRWLLEVATGQSLAFDLPLAVKALGGVLVLLGLTVEIGVMRVRKPREILDSTSMTLLKLIRRMPLENLGARQEPFLPRGVYRWVRNPMYFGVVLAVFGFGVLLVSASILLWGFVVTCYFAFFLIPREEKELNALFGESYRLYRSEVPMLFPMGRRFRADQPRA
jgi:hypothetical protein